MTPAIEVIGSGEAAAAESDAPRALAEKRFSENQIVSLHAFYTSGSEPIPEACQQVRRSD
jgi:hypothetical protein